MIKNYGYENIHKFIIRKNITTNLIVDKTIYHSILHHSRFSFLKRMRDLGLIKKVFIKNYYIQYRNRKVAYLDNIEKVMNLPYLPHIFSNIIR